MFWEDIFFSVLIEFRAEALFPRPIPKSVRIRSQNRRRCWLDSDPDRPDRRECCEASVEHVDTDELLCVFSLFSFRIKLSSTHSFVMYSL
mmetsp:Transcript_3614/g.6210  ORF Transcript_3614/g.6210 Transcript_3614/m.6210 type:complete len:90 (-) Transcript_3614:278-547(-)